MTKFDHDVRSTPPVAIRRTPRQRITRASAVGTAAQTIGSITPGVEISGLTNGQFSLIDMIEHVLREIGPADITVSTWTMGIYDQEAARSFYANGLIRSVKFIVDPSMFSRRPELSGPLVDAFGIDAFRAVNTHAKFATLRSDTHAISIRSSMNLNSNVRLEHFDISDCGDLCAFFEQFVAEIFERFAPPLKRSRRTRLTFEAVLQAFKETTRKNSPDSDSAPTSDLEFGQWPSLSLGNWPNAD